MTKKISESRVDHESAVLQTANSEVSPRRNMISNIPHEATDQNEPPVGPARSVLAQHQTEPAQRARQQGVGTGPAEHHAAPIYFVSPQRQTHRSCTDSGVMRQALCTMSKLDQGESESLAQYWAQFQELIAIIGVDEEIIGICLRRFLRGLVCKQQEEFINGWLGKSEHRLQAAQDCIVVLTRCWLDESMDSRVSDLNNRAAVGAGRAANVHAWNDMQVARVVTDGAGFTQDCPIQQLTPQRTHIPTIAHCSARRSGGNSPIDDSPRPNVTTRAAAMAHANAHDGETKKIQRTTIGIRAPTSKATNKRAGHSKRRQSQAELSKRTRETARTQPPMNDAAAQKTIIPGHPAAVTKVPSMLRELLDFNRPLSRQKSSKDQVESKRPLNKQMHILDPPRESEQEGLPSTPPTRAQRQPRTPVRRSHRLGGGRFSRIPTLVHPLQARPTIRGMSDAVCLPPVRPREVEEKQSMEAIQSGKKRKIRHESPPDIPILTLTPSDFNE